MKPAWDKLSDEFADSKTVIVADVDCTIHKDVCSRFGVKGYPTIKYFTGATAAEGDKYEGGRDYDSLFAFASTSLGPSCGFENPDLCDVDQKAALDAAIALSPEERATQIATAEATMAKAEEDFKTGVEGLQAQYKAMMEAKDAAVSEAGAPLRLLRSIKAPAAAAGHEEL